MNRWKDTTRVVIEAVKPEIDHGRFPIKRIIGDEIIVEADIFADGYDTLSAVLLYRKENDPKWVETPMEFLVNDRWRGSFRVTELGCYRYTLMAWVNCFKSWQQNLAKKAKADQDVSVDLLIGARLIADASQRAPGGDVRIMKKWVETLSSTQMPDRGKIQLVLSEEVSKLMDRYPDRRFATTYPKELLVLVDRKKACFSTWYEMFPRSSPPEPGLHGTFKDCEARLRYIASMGFDVLYFPPIHPIGSTHRKGKNNTPTADPDDPGTPWAIGSEEGGHKAVPEALTIGFVRRFTEYKRPTLVFRNIERLKQIVNNRWRPVQIIFAGKSHPADFTSKYFLHQVYTSVIDREFQGRIAFVEDYDMHMARYLVQGMDVWLNTPRRQNEACGTSGMKASLNGVLHLSVRDGWWHEGYNGANGWAIDNDLETPDLETEDKADAESLYRLLEQEIVPLYYERDRAGVPHCWIRVVKEAIRSVVPTFCARRMLKEYIQRMYIPAAQSLENKGLH